MALLERASELDVLAAALRQTRQGQGRAVFVGGPAGIGKTSLVEGFLVAAGPRLRPAWGYCQALTTPRPFGPILDLAPQIGRDLAGLLARDRVVPDLLPDILEAFRLGSPGVVVIEDAHRADEASLDILRFLIRRITSLPCLLVVTYRDDELDRRHLLPAMLGEFATAAAVRHLRPAPLSVAAVARLVGPAALDAAQVHQRTGGNPFLVVELTRSGVRGEAPLAFRDLVGERMLRLPDATRELLVAVALMGHAEPRVLAALAPRTEDAVERCIAAGLLQEGGGRIGFPHQMTQEAVLALTSLQTRTAQHARLLEALQAVGETDPERLAHHAAGAGDVAATRLHMPAAARRAAARGARREAIERFEAALRVVGAEEPEMRARLLQDHAQACAALDRQAAAVRSLDEAAALWRQLGEPRRAASSLAASALPLVRSGRNEEADARCRTAIQGLEPDGSSRDLAAALRIQAHLRMLDRDLTQALHFGRRAITMAEALGDRAVLAAANLTVGSALLVADQPGGRAHLDRAVAIARAEGLTELVALAFCNFGSAYAEQFQLTEAAEFLAQGIAFAAERDLEQDLRYMRAWTALLHLLRGELAEAVREARSLLEIADLAAISRIMALVALGRAEARLGRETHRAVLDEALALAERTGTLQRVAPVRLARAEAAWLAGDAARARQEAEAAWGLATGHRHRWYAGEVALWQARAGHAPPAPTWLAEPFALQLAGRWREAAAAWQARGCPYEAARALEDGDEAGCVAALAIYDRLGARPAAELLRRRMRLGGAARIPRGPTPATRDNPFGLTARQYEVALLLAGDETNAGIARRLGISAKTADHHVSAILAKLEVSTRREAGRLILGQAAATDDARRHGKAPSPA
jgi:DNA-binding CsgD family transcriptional regulator/tetratricopeptide (TPR) repeat protein